jgi:hypothetical protein
MSKTREYCKTKVARKTVPHKKSGGCPSGSSAVRVSIKRKGKKTRKKGKKK